MSTKDETAGHTPWIMHRIGETGFADGFDVYAVCDRSGREIFVGMKEQAEIIAAAPATALERDRLREALIYARRFLNAQDHDVTFVDAALQVKP